MGDKTKQDDGASSRKLSEAFSEQDVELLLEAISLHEDLEAAAYLTKIAVDHLTFPVKSNEELVDCLRAGRCKLRFRDKAWTYKDVTKFVSPQLFPIVDKSDLLRKTLIALSAGRRMHYHDDQARLMLRQ